MSIKTINFATVRALLNTIKAMFHEVHIIFQPNITCSKSTIRNTRKTGEIYSKLTLKTLERRN